MNQNPSNHNQVLGSERTRFSVPENQLAALLLSRRADTKTGVITVDRQGQSAFLSYADLNKRSEKLCAGLQHAGLCPGHRLILQLTDARDVITAFWGCMLAGVVPVPLNTAPSYDRPNSQSERLLSALARFGCQAVLGSAELVQPLVRLLVSQDQASPVLDINQCLTVSQDANIHTPLPDDPAAMFLTSGSTGAAKGVVQTHAAMLAMADGTIQMNGFDASDVSLNWMSLDHAGSLVFLGVMPLALGASQVHVPIDYVLKEPTRWLDLIEAWRASITWAPNFVFSLLLDRQAQMASRHWDLSSMRFMVNAGEAVVSATARRFLTLLKPYGLPHDALRPAFGMVETCSGITWSAGFDLEHTLDSDSFVSLGTVIPGAAMKILDRDGNPVDDGIEGRLLVKGPSVFHGYDGEDALNATVLMDGWLVTGDLAYIKAGQLYVTGREKDMVIINGNNYYCHEIESVVACHPAIASDCVAAVGVSSAGDNTERLVIFYHLVNQSGIETSALEKSLRAELAQVAGVSPAAFVELAASEFPRTEIGKIKRNVLKRRYEQGEFAVVGLTSQQSSEPRSRIEDPQASDSLAFRALLEAITAIWQRALQLNRIGLDDTFFELGGSSLLAIQVQHELEQLLGREVSMVELFDTPTIRSMAEHFSGQRADTADWSSGSNSALSTTSGDIAVIGIACRFPGAHGPEAFWHVLEQGVETLTFFSPEEAIAAGVPAERAHDRAQVNVAPILDNIEGCDLDFWKYARREAELLDPQQRVFLETAWEAFEDAGYVPGAALGKVGVYASAATNTYLQNNVYANRARTEENGGSLFTVNSVSGFNVMVANDKDYLPTRVSYKLDLTGPSMAIQTACSSTLVAVHEAVKALRSRECDMALAGGCALMLPQHAGHYYEEGMINSPDGHCRAYDQDAKGTVFGSGSGAVLLKRLDQALADGDAVYAVIKGSAVVNDGGQKMGFTAPSMLGEYRAISSAIQDAGVDAASIGFVEGHGTGTPIGDPIEVQALTRAFRHSTQDKSFCALGSVKTNIGHMGIASGIAGFIKAVLALHHKTQPATLHFNKANPAIAIENTPFFVSNRSQPWPQGSTPRRAGVNSLGIGGTNAHVILEEAPVPVAQESDTDLVTRACVVPVSALNETALRDQLKALARFVERHPEHKVADIAFTSQRGRLEMPVRCALVASDRDDLLAQLAQDPDVTKVGNGGRPVVFMFTGQGSQYLGMGKELYAAHAVFRDALDHCSELFAPHREHDIRELILSEADNAEAAIILNQTHYTQPALFCLQVALVQLYRQLGIQPHCIVGHSIGEVAGVWAAGGLSLEDAVTLVEVRSRLMQNVTCEGAMASVKADVDTVQKTLRETGLACEIAACNSPVDTTITGDADNIATVVDCLKNSGISVIPLTVSHAFHSAHMESVQNEFASVIRSLDFRDTQIPVICNLDASVLKHKEGGPEYWRSQLRAPVLFMQCLQAVYQRLQNEGDVCFVEIGPAAILCGLGRTLDSSAKQSSGLLKESGARWLPSLRKSQSDSRVFAQVLAALFESGHRIEWSASAAFDGRRIHLPTYAWQRERCWIDPDPVAMATVASDPLRGRPLVLPRLGQQIYTLAYNVATMPVLSQHRVFDVVVPPAALYASQLLYTASDFLAHKQAALADVHFVAPMHLADSNTSGSSARSVQILYQSERAQDTLARIELSSQPESLQLLDTDRADGSTLVQIHVTAELLAQVPERTLVDMDAVRQRCSEVLEPAFVEAHMAAMRVGLGDSFLCLRRILRGQNEALALLDVPQSPTARIAQGIPAGLIDSHWQTMLAALPEFPAGTLVPARIDSLICYTDTLPDQVWAYARIHHQSSTGVAATISLLAADGQILLDSQGIEFRVVAADSFRQSAARDGAKHQVSLYTRYWQEREHSELSTSTGRLPETVWIAGADADVGQWTSNLQQIGVRALPWSSTSSEPWPLLYVDSTGDNSSCASLNRLLASPAVSALTRIVVITSLDETPSRDAQAGSQRSALMAQAIAAAHELLDANICAIEMDRDKNSFQMLLTVISAPDDSGCRMRIKAGRIYTLRAKSAEPGDTTTSFSADKLQVITGGLGGLGLLTAQWMVRHGARRLMLISRSAPSEDTRAVLDTLVQQGADIHITHCDVGNYEQLQTLAAKAAQVAPIETLVHAAGVRRDGLINALQDEDFAQLMRSKSQAALLIRKAFAAMQPECTLYYSSIAAWLGAAGQSNYCAANAALDALAEQSSEAATRTISIAWGPWHQTGMMAELNESQRLRLRDQGYGFLEAEQAFDVLGRFMAAPTANSMAILAADIPVLSTLPGASSLWQASRTSSASGPVARVVTPQNSTLPALVSELQGLTGKQGVERLQEYLADLVIAMTRPGNRENVDFETGFLDMGIDSLASLELRKKLESALGLKLKSTLILDYPNITVMAKELMRQLRAAHPEVPVAQSLTGSAKTDRAELLRLLANEIDFQESV